MDRTPCFNTLAADRHLRLVERADAGLEDIHAELVNDMQRALAGLQGHVPGFVGFAGSMPREVLNSAADEAVKAVDRAPCAEALMLVLKDSTCPLVAKLRLAVIDGYVANNADSIAEARGGYQ